MSEDTEGSHKKDSEPDNWLGDLVKPGPRPDRHWLDGLVRSEEAEVAEPGAETPVVEGQRYEPTVGLEELPPHLKARLTDTGEVIPPEKRQTVLPPEEPVTLKKPDSKPTPSPRTVPGPALKPAAKPPASGKEREKSQVVVRVRLSAKSVSQRLMIYRAIAVMMEAGVQLYSCFEFLSEQAETEEVREACLRTAAELASGRSLALVAMSEPVLFSETSARMLEVGMRSGKLVAVLARLADDEQAQWEMRQRVWGKLFYPLTLALLALAAAVLLPPLALSSLLEQLVSFTDDPPAITKFLLAFSNALSSPVAVAFMILVPLMALYLWAQPGVRERVGNLEHWFWHIPWLGDVPRVAYSCRFLQLFALTHEVGLPTVQCVRLSAQASGSRVVAAKAEMMVSGLMAGETLSEAISSAQFLPNIAMESVEAGEQVGKLSDMMRKASDILLAELDYRIDTALKFIEPALLSVLGFFVGVFALGCLLPILKLTESL